MRVNSFGLIRWNHMYGRWNETNTSNESGMIWMTHLKKFSCTWSWGDKENNCGKSILDNNCKQGVRVYEWHLPDIFTHRK